MRVGKNFYFLKTLLDDPLHGLYGSLSPTLSLTLLLTPSVTQTGLGTLVKFTWWKVTWWSHNSLGDIKITWWIEIWHREIISHFVKSFLISWNQFLLGEKIFHIVKLSFTWWNENKRIILYDPEDHILESYYLILIRIWCAHFFLDGTLSSDFMDGRTAPGGQ